MGVASHPVVMDHDLSSPHGDDWRIPGSCHRIKENSDVAGTPSSIGFSVLHASPGLLAVAKPGGAGNGGVATPQKNDLV